tara:strand:- start:3116 stop:3439 length:324 start_codon:yes stop_codon:yes gene_type:complete
MNALENIGTTQEELAAHLIEVQAQIASLQQAEKVVKTMLRADGARSFTVGDHRVTITEASEKETSKVDWETVAKRAGASRQLITAHTSIKLTKSASAVRVFGPKTSK